MRARQWLGPGTIRGASRGVLLKGSGWSEIAPELWPIAAFMLAAGAIALNRYRETLG